MSELSVKLRALIADYQAGKISASKFVKKAEKAGADKALIGQVIGGTYKPHVDEAEISEEGKNKAAETQNQPLQEANPKHDAKAAQVARQKEAAAKYQNGSPAAAAVEAHDQQDESDIKMQAVVNNTRREDVRQGMEAEFKEDSDVSAVRSRYREAASKEDYKAAKEKLEQAKKDFKASPSKDTRAALADAQNEFNRVKAYYSAGRKRFLGIGSGSKRVAKANSRDFKNYTNVDEVRKADHLYKTKEAAKASGDKDAIYLTEEEYRGLATAQANIEYQLESAKSELAANPNDEKLQETVDILQRRYELCHQALEGAEDGKLDTAAVQNFIKSYTASDDRLNLEDEVRTLAADMGFDTKFLSTKNHKAREFVSKLGFGTESGTGQRLAAGAIGAGTAALGFLGLGAAATATAVATAGQYVEKLVQDSPGTPGRQEDVYDPSTGQTQHYQYEGTPAQYHTEREHTGDVTDTQTARGRKRDLTGPTTALLATTIAAVALTKPTTQHAFNEGQIDEVLNNALIASGKTAGDKRANRAMMQEIIDMDLSMVAETPVQQKAIKAAVIQQAIGGLNTGTANTEEIAAAKAFLELIQKNPELVTKADKPQEPQPTQQTTQPQTQQPDLDIEDEVTVTRMELPRMQYREGTWYTSHGYIKDNGEPLTDAERKMVQAELRKPENQIQGVDTNNDGKFNGQDKKVSLPKEITLPNGTKVKLAPDAYDRIMKLPAKGGGKNGNYGVYYDAKTHTYYVIDKNKPAGQQRVSQGYPTRAQAEAKKTELIISSNLEGAEK